MTAEKEDGSGASLEGALESYSRVARNRLALGIKAASWVGYGAASAALAVGSAAEASIVFVDATSAPVGPKTVVPGGTMSLDLDTNGVVDFSIALSSSSASMSAPVGNLFATAGTGNYGVRRFSSGSTIGPLTTANNTGVFFSASLPLTATTGTAGFGVDTGFLGVRFKGGGTDHFGWIRVNVMPNDPQNPTAISELQVLDWAYENVANAPIIAGQTSGGVPTPEPATEGLLGLGLLALGAEGLRRKRRRQRAPDSAGWQPSA